MNAHPRVTLVTLLTAFGVLGCNSDTPVAPTPTVDPLDIPLGPSVARPAFKVMTYNVQLSNFGAPNPDARKPIILQIIRSEAPDVVGLQELGFTHRADMEAGLQDAYDFYNGLRTGNSEPILLRKDVFTVGREGVAPVTTDQCGNRVGVTYLEARSPRGVTLGLFNTHSCFDNPEEHAAQLVEAVATVFPGVPAVVMGDLNARHGSDTMNFLLAGGTLLGLTSPVPLFDTWAVAGGSREPVRVGTGIDWILTTDGTRQLIDVSDAAVVENAGGASDHIPITATVS